MSEHPAIEALRRCRMDLSNAQARITDALNALEAASFKSPDPDPIAAIEREIANGVIADDIDLAAALRGLTDPQRYDLDAEAVAGLRASLPTAGRATTPAPDQRSAA